MSESPTKARHLRFIKSKQRRLTRDILRRGDDDEDGEDSESSDSEDESSSTKTKSETASTSALVTASDTATTFSTSIATESPASLGEVAGAAVEKTSSISESSIIAAIVVAILGLAVVAGVAVWLLRRRRTNTSDNDNNNLSSPVGRLDRGSRIWGGTTTVGTLTEVNFPVSQIPASMRPGGRDYIPNNFPHPETSGSNLSNELRLGPQRLTTQQPFPYQADLDVDNAVPKAHFKNRGSITGESSQPLKNDLPAEMRASIATTVPHFRNVTSWARDQRTRIAREDEEMPAGPYYKV